MDYVSTNGTQAAWISGEDGFFVFDPAFLAPASHGFEQLERFIAGAHTGLIPLEPHEVPNHIMEAATIPRRSDSVIRAAIDPTILAIMRLAEYYMITEGDVRQALQATVDIGIRDMRIRHPDKGVKREVQEIVDQLDLLEICRTAWFTASTYGTAWFAEFWDGAKRNRNGTNLKNAVPLITLLNPKHVVPSHAVIGSQTILFAPPDDVADEILGGNAPEYFYNSLGPEWNEVVQKAFGLPLDPEFVFPIKERWFMHNVFPVPIIAGAQRHLSTRQILEEMIRSTIEGVKTQLWIFTLSNPKKGEAKALKELLEGERGARTGYLIWSDNLEVRQYVPAAIEELLANETWQRMTIAVFRSLGIFMRAVSGESPNQRARDSELDISIWVDRMNAPRQRIQRALNRFAKHLGQSLGVDEPPSIQLNEVTQTVRGQIRDRLTPLLNFGLVSTETAMEMAGLDPETEVSNLRREWEDGTRSLIFPYSGFAQVGPRQGTVPSPQSQGRPDQERMDEERPTERPTAQASSKANYVASAQEAFQKFLEDRNVTAFIAALQELNRRERQSAYIDGYRSHGGIGQPDQERIQQAITWDQENLNRFEFDLLNATVRGEEEIAKLRYRAVLFAQQGWKQAYMMGMWQAKREQGWTSWRRIPRPNACAKCIEDGRITHPIEEEYFDVHPNDSCGYEFIQFMTTNTLSQPVPVVHTVNQRVNESANDGISESANDGISESANER